jgi:hypothetical protein
MHVWIVLIHQLFKTELLGLNYNFEYSGTIICHFCHFKYAYMYLRVCICLFV